MKYKYLSDSHVHSNFSFDAENTVFEMCSSAVQRGLYAITITDHCECPMIDVKNCEYGDFNNLIPKSINEIAKAKKEFEGIIHIYKGIELGEPLQNLKLTQKAFAYGNVDFTLASIHNLTGGKDFYFMEYNKDMVKNTLQKYFEEILQMVKWNNFDSLAHLTYPLRYIVGRAKIEVNLKDYSSQIDSILELLAHNGKALELNVSGLYKEFARTMPEQNIITRFKELGGKYITLGSDAHCAHDVSKGLEQGVKILIESGFNSFTIYKNHKPIILPLVLK